MNTSAAGIAPPLIDWFAQNARDLPWRRPGFSAWGTLVSEFMLQQTPVARVVPRLEDWLGRWPTPSALAASSPGDAVRAWQSLGYPRRALWLHACAVAITQQHGGEVPRDVDDLLALPGVGDYTARAVAAFAFGDRHPVVDTNIRRVIARAESGDAEPAPPSTRRDLAAMMELLPHNPEDAQLFNAAIMELGAVVCTARAPRCEVCPIAHLCAWRARGYPGYEGKRKAVQKKYEGSDRQVRGLVLARLRAVPAGSAVPVDDTAQAGTAALAAVVSREQLATVWHDQQQLDRAIVGLVADGLAVESPSGFRLP